MPTDDALEYLGFTIRLRKTEVEWMAVIAGRRQRPSIVLAADRGTVLAKARQWVEANSAADRGSR